MVVLRDGLSVLWRERGVAQIGVDPRCGVVLPGLTDDEQRLLDLLPAGLPLAEFERAGRDSGVGTERVRHLLAALDRAGVLRPENVPGTERYGPRHPAAPHAVDAAYWARLRADADGWSVLDRRQACTVGVLGAGRVGMLVASGLAASGAGTVLLSDPDVVRSYDVAPGAYHARDIGRPRQEAGAETLRALTPLVRTSAPPRNRPDVCVLVEHGVANPVRARPLVREDLVHLSVVVGDVDVTIGPLVVPGDGPCLRCLDLHRCDADDRWPAVATQVAARPADGTETSLAPLAAALAVGQVLAWIDGREPETRGASLEVAAISPVPRRRPWSTHPDCGCVELDHADDANPRDGRNAPPTPV